MHYKFYLRLSCMVLLLLIPFITLKAQNKPETITKKIDSLIGLALPKSALKEVDNLKAWALNHKSAAQEIKATIYRINLIAYIGENSFDQIIGGIKSDILKSTFPVKSVLESLLAEMYFKYFQNKRYEILKRTPLLKPDSDVKNWDIPTLIQESSRLYKASLSREISEQKTPTHILEGVLQGDPSTRNLRPTLYDILIHRALDFYLSEEAELIRPILPFDLNKPDFFEKVRQFSNLKIRTRDSLSAHYLGLFYLQKAIQFHLKFPNEEALADLDLMRMDFIYNHSQLPDRDSLYLAALKTIGQDFSEKPIMTNALVAIGQFYTLKDSLVRAHEYFKMAFSKFPKSLGGQNASILMKDIEQKSLIVNFENIGLPNHPILMNLQYRNIASAYLKIYKLSRAQREEYENLPITYPIPLKKKLDYLQSRNPVQITQKSWIPIPDYKAHHFEIGLDSLPTGNYVYIVQEGNGQDSTLISLGDFKISHLAYSFRQNPLGETEIRVMDREIGKPLTGAQIKMEGKFFEHGKTESIFDTGFTNSQGQFISRKFIPQKRNYSISCEFHFKGEELKTREHYIYPTPLDEDTVCKERTLIFTDRQLYRPGQTVYFKILELRQNKDRTQILMGDTLSISFMDSNTEQVGKVSVKTNAYGTASGKFLIPKNILSGRFTLEVEDDRLEVQIEEYKRPSFQLEILPLKGAHKIGDSIRIQGRVTTFSGYGLSQTKIQFHITREKVFPSWDYNNRYSRRRNPNFGNNKDEILFGDIQTNNAGEFSLVFKASPNPSEGNPNTSFRYSIQMEGTDGAGETQSINTALTVGISDISMNYLLPENIFTKDTFNTSIGLKNLNNQSISGDIIIQIWALNPPKKIFKDRVWEKPDQFEMGKAVFSKLFPDYAYGDENTQDSWEGTHLPMDQKLNIKEPSLGVINLNALRKVKPGNYKIIVLGKNCIGDSLSEIHYIKVIQDTVPLTHFSDWEIPLRNQVLPSQAAQFQVGIHQDIMVLVEELDGSNLVSSRWMHIPSETQIISMNLSKLSKAPAIQFMMVYHNRFYSHYERITRVEMDTSLKIKMLSFRNKMEPGSKEIWKMQITNPKESPLQNEILASLYDRSLDEISPPSGWDQNMNWGVKNYPHYFMWSGFNFIEARSSNPIFYIYRPYNFIKYEYETLNLMGYEYYGGYNVGYNQFIQYSQTIVRNFALRKKHEEEFNSLIKLPHSGYWIYGQVKDQRSREGLAAHIMVQGQSIQINSDREGYFTLKVKAGSILVIHSMGYEEKKTTIYKEGFIDLSLKLSTNDLNSKVVIGYGSANKISTAALDLPDKIAEITISAPPPSPNMALHEVVTVNSPDFNSRIPKKSEEKNYSGSQTGNGKLIQIRKNFSETAFFFPDLITDKIGELKLEFTMPEALTEWKFRVFTHNPNLQWGYMETRVITQKQFSIEASMPRFLREGDTLKVSARLSNLSDNMLRGKVHLAFFNEINRSPIQIFINPEDSLQDFELGPKTNKPIGFSLRIPKDLDGITYLLSAESGSYFDGEENTLAVIPNRIPVLETMPMMIRSGQTQTYTLDKLLNQTSKTLENKSLTLEYTQNPAWYALLSMPYLMEFPYECSEQLFSRYFANSLASELMNHNPNVKKVFDIWKKEGSTALFSALEKNPELKSTLIEETPWLREAINERERRKRLFLLFELNKMSSELKINLDKLKEKQLPDGGFPWFAGQQSDRYITQHILMGMGQLNHLQIKGIQNEELKVLQEKALSYLDSQLEQDYKDFQRIKPIKNVGAMNMYSWYVRSFFPEKPLKVSLKSYFNKYLAFIEKQWPLQPLYSQGLIAFTLIRNGKMELANKILKSLIERSQDSPEEGMFWPNIHPGHFWYESPVETQALMIELFTEEGHYAKLVEELKIWLLRNKQTQNWSNTKATSEAIYALLLKQDSWLSDSSGSSIALGGQSLSVLKPELKKELATGYFKTTWSGKEIKPELAKITIENKGKSIGWGGLYWQYLEASDKISPSKTDIILTRKYFIQKPSDRGPILTEVDNNHIPKLGDLLKVVVYLKSGRDFEYIQLKDMRPAGTEPISALSEYKYQDGLYYYQVTKDIATNFFIGYLNKGNYVFEYGLRVTQPGNFSTGISSIGCMYAPEFTAHSAGKRIVFLP